MTCGMHAHTGKAPDSAALCGTTTWLAGTDPCPVQATCEALSGVAACRTGILDHAETPFCQAMVELGVANHGVPERLHPKSFHANFGHNTNVWATRNKQVIV